MASKRQGAQPPLLHMGLCFFAQNGILGPFAHKGLIQRNKHDETPVF
jgi:hypothetical protein